MSTVSLCFVLFFFSSCLFNFLSLYGQLAVNTLTLKANRLSKGKYVLFEQVAEPYLAAVQHLPKPQISSLSPSHGTVQIAESGTWHNIIGLRRALGIISIG